MNLARLDLNLLVYLDALLTEQSVTKAAAKLGLSQPALSAALSRLRRHFGDELLARRGNSYELTPLASRLAEQTQSALLSVGRVFTSQAVFSPTESRREFTILGSDYAFAVLGPTVGDLASRQAPEVRLRFTHHTPSIVNQAAEALRTADAMLLPHGFLTDLPFLDVYEDTWMCMVAASNERVGDKLTMSDLAELPWVFTYHEPTAFTPAGRQLQMIGIEPRVECVVESFLALPFFIARSQRIAMVQGHLAERLTAGGDVRVLPCPFEVVPLAGAMWWHPMHTRDPEHAWLRSLFIQAGQVLASPAATAAAG
jgi:DNA-binding transcriptional LysR family regulator